MQDMLVRLYALPDAAPMRAALAEQGVRIRPCRPYEAHALYEWVGRVFSSRWVSECTVAMAHTPCGCIIATYGHTIVGFACFDATARGFIGPMGVDPTARGRKIGAAVLITALEHMRALGYAYAVIGGVGPAAFYEKSVGASPIADSDPGIYADILPEPPSPSPEC